jgi:ABC-type multidrug transport system fused ATPase/permease subunit
MFKHSFFYKYLSPSAGRIGLNILLRAVSAVLMVAVLVGVAPVFSLLFGMEADSVTGVVNGALMQEFIGFLDGVLAQMTVHYGSISTLLFIIGAFALLFFLKNIFDYLGFYTFTPVRTRAIENIRNDLYRQLLILPLSFFSKNKRGDLLSRMGSDVQEIDEALLKSTGTSIGDIIMFVGLVLCLFLISIPLASAMIIVLPLAAWIIGLTSRSLKRKSPAMQATLGHLTAHIEESMRGVKTIFAYNNVLHSMAKFDKENEKFTRIKTSVYRHTDLGSPVSEVIGTFFILLLLVAGGWLIFNSGGTAADVVVSDGAMVSEAVAGNGGTAADWTVSDGTMASEAVADSGGTAVNVISGAMVSEVVAGNGGGLFALKPEAFVVFLLILIQLIVPAKNLANAWFNVKRGRASVARIKEILSSDEVVKQDKNAFSISDFNNSIEFKNVWFWYDDPTQAALKGISLTVRKGQHVAFAGLSGSGKSTLINLIPRFYDPTQGEVYIDDKNITHSKINDIRALSSLISQDTILFNDTFYNNIRFGRENATRNEIEQAAKKAFAHDFITATEKGYDTVVGNSGVKLSGGERQRISIARALLKDAPILILDEASASLDTQAEQYIQSAVAELKNKTIITVAHRLSTIRNADCIYVMEKGNIVESGTHDFLATKSGTYSKLLKNG